MRIKKLEIDGRKLCFSKNDNCVFIKENKNYASVFYESVFIESLRKLFVRHYFNVDGFQEPDTNIKCVCEKGGIDFTVSIRSQKKRLPERSDRIQCRGSFILTGKFKPKTDYSDHQKRLIRSFKSDIKEFFMPEDTDREIAFFDRGMASEFTDIISFHYYDNLERALKRSSAMQSEEENRLNGSFIEHLKIKCAVIEKFIKDFKRIDLGTYSLGFDKKNKEFKAFGKYNVSDFEVFKRIGYYDFLTANKLDEAIKLSEGDNDLTPIFVVGFFQNMSQEEIKIHLEELRETNRQVFIVENTDNPYLEKNCDKTICFGGDDDMIEEKGYKRFFPTFTPPLGGSQEECFDGLVETGALSRYGNITKAVRTRIEDEKRVYKNFDYVNCVLVIADLVNGLKKEKYEFITSGPQCGSIINYVLGITDVDPVKHGFIFERYINEAAQYRGFYPNYCIGADNENISGIVGYIKKRYGDEAFIKLKPTDEYFEEYVLGLNLKEHDILKRRINNCRCELSEKDVWNKGLFVLRFYKNKLLNIISDCKKTINDELEFDMDSCCDDKTWEYLSSGKFIYPVYKNNGAAGVDTVETIFKNRLAPQFHDLCELSGFVSIGGFGGYIAPERMIDNYLKYNSIIPQVKILNQEDFLSLIHDMTGLPLCKCNTIRKRIAKRGEIDEVRTRFIDDCIKNGYSKERAEEIFDSLKEAARYLISKTHTYYNAYLLYQLAYISVHYPKVYDSVIEKHEIV